MNCNLFLLLLVATVAAKQSDQSMMGATSCKEVKCTDDDKCQIGKVCLNGREQCQELAACSKTWGQFQEAKNASSCEELNCRSKSECEIGIICAPDGGCREIPGCSSSLSTKTARRGFWKKLWKAFVGGISIAVIFTFRIYFG